VSSFINKVRSLSCCLKLNQPFNPASSSPIGLTHHFPSAQLRGASSRFFPSPPFPFAV
jgi:hypothetical protein